MPTTADPAAGSPLAGRLVLVLAPAGDGGDLVTAVLAALPGVARCPATHVFDEGLAALHANHVMGSDRDGFTRLASEAAYLALLRKLGDDLLAPHLGTADLLVEYTPSHLRVLATIRALYPDARLVHVVRDGRESAAAHGATPRRPRQAIALARAWRDAHLTIAANSAGAHRVRVEDLRREPAVVVRALAASLGVDPGDQAIGAAVETVRRSTPNGHRSSRFVRSVTEVVARDMLEQLGYR